MDNKWMIGWIDDLMDIWVDRWIDEGWIDEYIGG